MADQEHLNVLKQGSDAWNAWRQQHFLEPHLDNANLRGADLDNADLNGADLHDVDLRHADLSLADLRHADLRHADLRDANLSGARLTRADLSGANICNATLLGTIFKDANLSSADLSDALLSRTIFANIDLSTVKGLTQVRQLGPSSIDIDTIYRSGGKIPESFLEGAGVPDSFLTYMRSLIGKPIEYFTCFISHSSKDQRFCNRLYADLRAKRVRTWYFPEDATWGKPVWREIDRSIKLYDKLVVVCSQHSLQSGPVLREIERALQREDREGTHILFPIRIDNYLFQEWEHERKADVLSKVVGDFRGWNRNAEKYETAFTKFLKALKAQEEAS
ncbi:MAG TPA: toll/interleukin-1 receptor domain-containing protein [Ktedonobacteraceae bacterium]|nr:toll/interleukin-1 receptor domain-containing protein [Ktedonobacteraceae bacterium]